MVRMERREAKTLCDVSVDKQQEVSYCSLAHRLVPLLNKHLYTVFAYKLYNSQHVPLFNNRSVSDLEKNASLAQERVSV